MNSWEIRNSCCLLGCPFCWLRMRMPQLLTPPFNHWLGDGLPTYGLIEIRSHWNHNAKGLKRRIYTKKCGWNSWKLPGKPGKWVHQNLDGPYWAWRVHRMAPRVLKIDQTTPSIQRFHVFSKFIQFLMVKSCSIHVPSYSVCVTKTGFSNKLFFNNFRAPSGCHGRPWPKS